jgi:hypothetical protein
MTCEIGRSTTWSYKELGMRTSHLADCITSPFPFGVQSRVG